MPAAKLVVKSDTRRESDARLRERDGTKLENCPPYVRERMDREKD
jgi:hypothetical protein